MRKVVAAAFVSLDGVMQAPGGPQEDTTGGFKYGGWLVPYSDERIREFIDGMFSTPFDLLLGHTTYEIFAAYWPFIGDESPIAARFNRVTKYVATSSPEPLTWAKSIALSGDVAAEVARLKQGAGPRLLTQGSGRLLQTLMAHDLIDEFRILTFPLMLGRGKRLFRDGIQPGALKLTETAISTTGVVMSVYERAGEIRTGSFGPDSPSEAEIARRERMKRQG
ncbi:dihydrofolate reductase [Rhizobium sp. P32RR-XVIII]|uniref:dihydrofolate reductase family protein n=1 Tax=Rhizobium sp. P32RR-XVIII TaxID=2726738 RepID=UPI001456A607|nr:dihydrofolate reductase family protein [Rhizobium sp. P32RR-XVIII]NLS02598.1 dihydrofolate reductase [Rhizobium sp. P32RR-XVIII]